MKIFIRLSSLLIISILAMTLRLSSTQAQQGEYFKSATDSLPYTADLPWRGGYIHRQVDPPLKVGLFPSMGFTSDEAEPYLLYYNQSAGRLMRAQPSPPGMGNCGDHLNWFCMDDGLFPNDNIGMYVSYDEWTDGVRWRLGYSFYDLTNRSLAFYIMTCDSSSCTKDHGFIEIATSTNISVGLYTSFKYNLSGVPYVAYFRENSTGEDVLMVAHLTYDWSGNCGGGQYFHLWQCEVVNGGDNMGQYASLDISWDNKLYVAYHDGHNADLKFAQPVANGGNCGLGKWKCEIVDGMPGNVGDYVSISAPISAEDNLDIAYYAGGMLKYAYPAAGGNCGGGAWRCMWVDSMGNSLEPMGISLDVDLEGSPVIAYQKIASPSSTPALRIARPYWAFHDIYLGDCGEDVPEVGGMIWRCKTLDPGNQYAEEGDYISLKVSQTGLIGIAYSEDETEDPITSLKYISQYYQTFLPHIGRK